MELDLEGEGRLISSAGRGARITPSLNDGVEESEKEGSGDGDDDGVGLPTGLRDGMKGVGVDELEGAGNVALAVEVAAGAVTLTDVEAELDEDEVAVEVADCDSEGDAVGEKDEEAVGVRNAGDSEGATLAAMKEDADGEDEKDAEALPFSVDIKAETEGEPV